MSGLTLFLPHGYEAGPRAFIARFERYLQLCAENNMYVVNATTPANLFHVLRRQMKNEFRIPLVMMSPKSLLRHPKVQSNLSDLHNGSFKKLLMMVRHLISASYVALEKFIRFVRRNSNKEYQRNCTSSI